MPTTVKEKEAVNYPMFSTSVWWALRKKFIQTVPSRVTDTYLAGVLGMEPISAKKNLLSPLRRLGLIDSDGKPTDRAIRWRNDDQYAAVCEEIRKDIYPQELLDTFPDANSPRSSVEKWFANATRVGEGASKKMATLYFLLTEADPTGQESSSATIKVPKPSKTTSSAPKSNGSGAKKVATDNSNGKAYSPTELETKIPPPSQRVSSIVPSLHIDIQIHIPPDASAEQIDQIFASMSKHLYKGSNVNE